MARESERSLAIAAGGEPEFGGMVGERILVMCEQFVVAGCRLAAPVSGDISWVKHKHLFQGLPSG